MTGGWIAAAIAIVVWGVTFASTRVLVEEFSALEINIARFALAWVALACAAKCRAICRSSFLKKVYVVQTLETDYGMCA